MSDTGAVERAARAAYEEAYDEPEQPLHPWNTPWVKQAWLDIARAALAAAAPTVEQVAEVLGEALWRRQSDVLERRAFAFSDAPSRMHYLAHGRALAEEVAALWGGR